MKTQRESTSIVGRWATYADYLASSEWAERRRRAVERASGRCQLCNDDEDLNVHHRTYDRIGCEDDGDLTVLCGECHARFHGKRPRKRRPVALLTEDANDAELLGLLAAYERDELVPVEVVLGALLGHAGEDDRRVADDLRLLLGLRYADGDFRPLPYSVRFCCARMGWPEDRPMKVSRILNRLERWRVINCTGTLTRQPGAAYATKTYEPPSDAVGKRPAERWRIPKGAKRLPKGGWSGPSPLPPSRVERDMEIVSRIVEANPGILAGVLDDMARDVEYRSRHYLCQEGYVECWQYGGRRRHYSVRPFRANATR